MQLTGYECNQCQTHFEDVIATEPHEQVETKCPKCNSQDVTQSEAVSEFLELIREMGRTGG